MTKVKVRRGGIVSIPAEICEQLGVHPGDELEVGSERGRIVFTPRTAGDRDPEAKAAIAEGLADLRGGRLSPPFETAEEIAAWQKTDDYKKFIGDA